MQSEETGWPLPGGGTLALRPVTPADEEFLLAVYFSSRADELAQVEWAEGQKEAFVRWQFETQRREYEARFPGAEYSVVLVDGRPAGRVWVGRDAEQIRLLDIALLPEFRGRGIGAALVRRLMDESERTGLPLRHMVFQLNEDALRFYERLGFTRLELHGAYWEMEKKP